MISGYGNRSTMGVTMRFFVPEGADAKKEQKMYQILLNAFEKIINCKLINRVQVLIPEKNGEIIDKGSSYKKVVKEILPGMGLTKNQQKKINIVNVDNNNGLNYGLLNYGIFRQSHSRVSHVLSMSPENYEYLSDSLIESIIDAFSKKAIVVQPVINELADPILNHSVVDNALCAWDLGPLISTGCFPNITEIYGDSKVPFKCGEAVAQVTKMKSIYGDRIVNVPAKGNYNPYDFGEREALKWQTKLSLEGYINAANSVLVS